MATVEIAVPMARGRRRFRVERGRRWSLIEHLLLEAVARNPASAGELEKESGLPRRVVIEAFIRLMRVGWVQVEETTSGARFSATPSGLVQVESGVLKAPTAVLQKWMAFTIDQATGMVFRGSRSLRVQSGKRLTKSEQSHGLFYLERARRHQSPDLASVFDALSGDDEIVVGVDATVEKLFEGYTVFTVVDGLIVSPIVSIGARLKSTILTKAAEVAPPSEQPKAATPALPALPDARQEPRLFDHADVILGGQQHKDLFETIIARAREEIVIHSTFISEDGWRRCLPLLLSAVARNVKIHVFWGQADDNSETSPSRKAAFALFEKMASEGRGDRLVVHPFTTGSHAKIVVSDDGRGGYVAVIGSCNWLSTDFASFEASVRLRDPYLVGNTLGIIAQLSTISDGMWNPTASSLTNLGRIVASRRRPAGRLGNVQILKGAEHSNVPLEARDRARSRIVVASHRIGIAGKPMVLIPALAAVRSDREQKPDCRIFYGKPTGPLSGLDTASLAREFVREGVEIRPIFTPRLHAKVLAWDDDDLVVTSQNWLSADPSNNSPDSEIGVRINLNKVADNFITTFDATQW